MIRRTQYFSPDDEGESDYKELESPEIETGTLAIGSEPSLANSAHTPGTYACFPFNTNLKYL